VCKHILWLCSVVAYCFESIELKRFLLGFSLESIKSVKEKFFAGNAKEGYEPYFGIVSVADGTAKAVGHLFAASIVNGGPAPGFISPWIFEFMVNGITDAVKICPQQLDNTVQVKGLFEKVIYIL